MMPEYKELLNREDIKQKSEDRQLKTIDTHKPRKKSSEYCTDELRCQHRRASLSASCSENVWMWHLK